jgi:hypothetical protein
MDKAKPQAEDSTLSGVDPAQALAELRAQIRQRSARLGGRLDAGAGGGGGGADFSMNQVRQSVDEVNDLWFVSAHLPITWKVPGVGTAIAYAKKATRVLLRWYINPIVEQQNRYNSAVARALVEITAYQERLTREWQVLEERVLALEAQVNGETPPGGVHESGEQPGGPETGA